MIPITDTVRARRPAVMTWTIIAINVLIFLNETLMGRRTLMRFTYHYGLVPAHFWSDPTLWRWVPVFTSMFIHGGWAHIISNMLALYIFGDNVEDRMGPFRFLVFYLLSGFIAAMAHLWFYPDSTVPTVGASGAIAGVLGAYLVLYPTASVITMIPVFFFWPLFIDIPALIYLGFWFVSQLLNGVLALSVRTFQSGGVAWWAHIGGFIAGIALVWLFIERPRRRFYPDEYFPW